MPIYKNMKPVEGSQKAGTFNPDTGPDMDHRYTEAKKSGGFADAGMYPLNENFGKSGKGGRMAPTYKEKEANFTTDADMGLIKNHGKKGPYGK